MKYAVCIKPNKHDRTKMYEIYNVMDHSSNPEVWYYINGDKGCISGAYEKHHFIEISKKIMNTKLFKLCINT